jgi:hypothetical protein
MTILAVASGIRMHIDNAARADASATEHWIKAGQLLLHARERIESGKEGNAIDWGGGASAMPDTAKSTAKG